MTDFDELDIEPMILRLYEQVKPLYQQLHAYVRRRLIEVYPNNALDSRGPIPAHLLGTLKIAKLRRVQRLTLCVSCKSTNVALRQTCDCLWTSELPRYITI